MQIARAMKQLPNILLTLYETVVAVRNTTENAVVKLQIISFYC